MSVSSEPTRHEDSWLRRVGRGLAVGLGVGLLIGVGARTMMRLLALTSEQATSFSWVGTTGIVMVCAVFAMAAALLLSLTQGRVRATMVPFAAVVVVLPHAPNFVAFMSDISLDDLSMVRVVVLVLLLGVYGVGLALAILGIHRLTRRTPL
jgi:hypothetical protein